MSDESSRKPSAEEWIRSFAALLGEPVPDDETTAILLSLAGDAAHGSERVAAPIACYLVGRAGIEPAQALAMIREG